MDVISTAPRHNIDDSLKCSGVKGSLMSMQKGAKNDQNAQFRIYMWKAEKNQLVMATSGCFLENIGVTTLSDDYNDF